MMQQQMLVALVLNKRVFEHFICAPNIMKLHNSLYFFTEMAAIEAKFPNFKSTLLNCFMKVSNHMKNANFIARPAFKRVKNGSISDWQASYSLKWPEPKEFSGIGTNRAEAEK